jgi:hypothetical protein
MALVAGSSTAAATAGVHSAAVHVVSLAAAATFSHSSPHSSTSFSRSSAAFGKGGSTNIAAELSGPGALQRLLTATLSVLEQAALCCGSSVSSSSSSDPSVSAAALQTLDAAVQGLLSFIARYATALRAPLLHAGGLRIVARATIEVWMRVDEAEAATAALSSLQRSSRNGSTNSSSSAAMAASPSAEKLLHRCLQLLLLLTPSEEAPSLASCSSSSSSSSSDSALASQPPHPVLAALLNRLGCAVLVGPPPASAIAADTPAAADSTVNSNGHSSGTSTFVLALHLLGNLVAGNAWCLAFLKSNNSNTSSSHPSTSTASGGAVPLSLVYSLGSASTSLSLVNLRALYKRLVACLPAPHMESVLHALRLLAHLAIETKSTSSTTATTTTASSSTSSTMEARLFNAGNVEQTFQLVFNLIVQAISAAATASSSSSSSDNTEMDPSIGLTLLLPAAVIDVLSTLLSSASLRAALEHSISSSSSSPGLVVVSVRAIVAAMHDTPALGSGVKLSVLGMLHALAQTRVSPSSSSSSSSSSSLLQRALMEALLLDSSTHESLLAIAAVASEATSRTAEDVSVAVAAVQLLCTLLEIDVAVTEHDGDDDGALCIALNAFLSSTEGSARASLASWALSLRWERLESAQKADANSATEATAIEEALRVGDDSGVGGRAQDATTTVSSVATALLARSFSTGAHVATMPVPAPAVAPAVTFTPVASPRTAGICSIHRTLAVSVAHLFLALQRCTTSTSRRAAAGRASLDNTRTLQQLASLVNMPEVRRSARALLQVGQTQQRHLELCALLHLMSAFGGSDGNGADAADDLLSLLPAEQDEPPLRRLGALLAPCLIAASPSAHPSDDWTGHAARCVADALYLVARLSRGEGRSGSSAHSAAATATDEEALRVLAEGIVVGASCSGTSATGSVQLPSSSSSSSTSSALQQQLSSERARVAALSSSLSEIRASSLAALSAHQVRERELQARVAEAEARLASEQNRAAEAQQIVLRAHQDEVEEMQAKIEQQQEALRDAHAAQQAREAQWATEATAAASRAAQVEQEHLDLQQRYQSVLSKLTRAGEGYAAQVAYGERLVRENATLRTEAEAQMNSLHAQLASALQERDQARQQGLERTRRLEDAYAKLVLLDRALGQQRASTENAEREQGALRRALADRDEALVAAQEDAQRVADRLAQREEELAAVSADLDASIAAQARLEDSARSTAQRLASAEEELRAQEAELQHAGTQILAERSRAAEELAAVRSDAARQLTHKDAQLAQTQEQLNQLQQLNAMIHKLSAQQAGMQAKTVL